MRVVDSAHGEGCTTLATEFPISFDLAKLAEARSRIPAADFINPQYDVDHGVVTTDVLILLSTPRSGSTLVCELLRMNDVCLPHEYCQPGQYMPILAERWRCLDGESLNEDAYVRNLLRFRTNQNGWFGLNLHGSHLRYYIRMERLFAGVRFHYVHLVRRRVMAQAISYHVASQSRQWSSQFDAASSPAYQYERIVEKLERIQKQNALIEAFLVARTGDWLTLYYEDLIAQTEEALRRMPCIRTDQPLQTNPTLRRQADKRSVEWTRRFAQEFMQKNGEGQVRKIDLLSSLRRVLRKRSIV